MHCGLRLKANLIGIFGPFKSNLGKFVHFSPIPTIYLTLILIIRAISSRKNETAEINQTQKTFVEYVSSRFIFSVFFSSIIWWFSLGPIQGILARSYSSDVLLRLSVWLWPLMLGGLIIYAYVQHHSPEKEIVPGKILFLKICLVVTSIFPMAVIIFGYFGHM